MTTLNPCIVSELTLTTENTTLKGRAIGRGPPIVLLHGGPGCYDYFDESVLANWLSPFRTVLSYDQRGCRHSHSTGPFTVETNAADLEAIRRHLGTDQFELLGHSAGTALAVHYLATHPQRVSRIVYLSPAPLSNRWREAFNNTLKNRMTEEQRLAVNEIDRIVASSNSPSDRSELYRRRFEVMLPCYVDDRHRDRAPGMPHYNREVNLSVGRTLESAFLNPGWRDAVRRFASPACIIHGRSDPIPLGAAYEYGSILPNATVHTIEHCGHFPWLEEPDELRRLLFAFLSLPG